MRRQAALTALVLAASLVAGTVSAASGTPAGMRSSAGPQPAPRAPQAAPQVAPDGLSAVGRWIVTLRPGASVSGAGIRARTIGVSLDHVYRSAVRGYAARLNPLQVARLRTDPTVASVVPDALIRVTGQSVPRGVRRIGGRGSVIARIDGVDDRVDADVAIVDTGIDKSHEDLNVVGGISCSTDDPNLWGDPYGHGTHVAGTVGALDNGFGVVGVAPGVRLWSVRILDAAGNGLLSWYVCGLDWIAAQRDPVDPARPLIEVANMSEAKLGSDDRNCGYTNGDVVHQAVCRVVAGGTTLVAAAGNNSFDASRLIPSSYDEAITVSALADSDGKPGGLGGNLCFSWGGWDRDDTFADFSNYGHDVDLIAPGKCTWSTLPGDRYGWMSGTSMAAPHVAGAAALYMASRPLATPDEVRAALIAAGNLGWKTATDPDRTHEPMLDVSHIVGLGDFNVDATPGTSFGATVSAAGATLHLPVEVVRAEDFPAAIDLATGVDAPITATVANPTLTGLGATSTTIAITVPPATPSGRYSITVTASDGSRERSSVVVVTVDSDTPSVSGAVGRLAISPRLTNGLAVRMAWRAVTDAGGPVSRIETRWKVDGTAWSAITALAPTATSVVRTMVAGHVYTLAMRARDAAGNWSPWTGSPPTALAIVQDRSPAIGTAGRWLVSPSSSASGGSTRFAKTKGSAIAIAFHGRAVSVVAPRGPGRGRVLVYVDGAYAGTVNLWAAVGYAKAIVFSRSWGAAGDHRIRLVVAGTRGHPRVDVDAFAVLR